MNPQQAWNFAIDELNGSPAARAAAECRIVAYDDKPGNRTLTVLAPNKTIAHVITGNQTLISKLTFGLDILSLNLVVDVAEDADKAPESPASAAWEKVLETLQQESPRASFDTWIKDTQAAELKNGILTITTRNAYARDWLENRIQESGSKLASRIIGQDVALRFVVGKRPSQPEDEGDPDDDGGPEENDDEQPGRNELLEGFDTAYQAEVKPGRIIAIPGYALRLLQQGDLTAKEMSLWVAFRQAVWSMWKRGKGSARNIPHQDILQFAMMSKPSYFREITGKTSIAGGLVEEAPAEWTPGPVNRHLDNARRWRVNMAPRLTHQDCNAIHAVLHRVVAETSSIPEALDVTQQALQGMAAQPPHNYLDEPKNQEIPLTGWPKGVIEIVRRVTGYKGDLPEELHKAAEKLQDHIIGGYGTVIITHYFLQIAAPKLGLSHGQAWTIIALRDRCWYDHINQKPYSFAVLQNGMQELASLTRATVKSARNWLNDPAFQMFVAVEDTDGVEFPESWGWNPMVLDVRQDEPTAEERGAVLIAESDDSGKKRVTIREKMINGQGKNDKRPGKKRVTDWEKVINGQGKNDKRLNNFIKPQLSPTKPHESPHTPRQNSAQKPGVGSRAYWEWDDLMSKNSVSLPMSKKLLIANKQAGHEIASLCHNFVSWMLYAYSEAGRGVKNPVSNALARLQENTFSGAGGDFERLATLTPHELKSLIDADLAGKESPNTLAANLYEFNFTNTPQDYKRELRRRLFD
ncbi:MAG: DnaA N-terminal domain-containing protein [Anaerolineales bacterium]|jgi:hypothetical protein|nr:DnaA N-terminal domain-containing protein [Anaerolineales bacterium]